MGRKKRGDDSDSGSDVSLSSVLCYIVVIPFGFYAMLRFVPLFLSGFTIYFDFSTIHRAVALIQREIDASHLETLLQLVQQEAEEESEPVIAKVRKNLKRNRRSSATKK